MYEPGPRRLTPEATVRVPQREALLQVEFERGPTFDCTLVLKSFLEDHLGRKVDLVTPAALKPRMRSVVERDSVERRPLDCGGRPDEDENVPPASRGTGEPRSEESIGDPGAGSGRPLLK